MINNDQITNKVVQARITEYIPARHLALWEVSNVQVGHLYRGFLVGDIERYANSNVLIRVLPEDDPKHGKELWRATFITPHVPKNFNPIDAGKVFFFGEWHYSFGNPWSFSDIEHIYGQDCRHWVHLNYSKKEPKHKFAHHHFENRRSYAMPCQSLVGLTRILRCYHMSLSRNKVRLIIAQDENFKEDVKRVARSLEMTVMELYPQIRKQTLVN